VTVVIIECAGDTILPAMPSLPHTSTYARRVSADEINVLLGPFDDLQPIGDRSGSGECWVARTGADRHVLKIVVHEHEPGRFEREVTALARLNSPRVMRVHEHGEVTTSADTFPYLRSEFVPGGSLAEHLTAGLPVADRTIRDFLTELLRGLSELTDARIVHRDLKPHNIILRDGVWSQPVVIDLGLSRLLDATSFTVYPWACGTWPYMAPEQLRAERATDRSDVWAAAVIAAEVARGSHPFFRGEAAIPRDWDTRLQAGPAVPGSRPAALRDWIQAGTNYRGYRRPSAERSVELLEETW
jgi:eukaryotic-like serine/threonine-protein kinase